MNVLFLCTGNSCRSILGEAVFNHLAPVGSPYRAMSAGSQPTGQVHPRSLALLAREGIATQGYYSKSWDNLPHTPDIVITVCASAAGESCPAYLGPVLRVHWGVDDPAHVSGSDAEIDAAFYSAYRLLRQRIEAFFALDLEALQKDPAQLKAALERIGQCKGSSALAIQIFDPALCCSTGVCGVEVDQTLVRVAADVAWAAEHGVSIERFNLAQQPLAFAENATVKAFLERCGAQALPLVLVAGQIALAGRYPTRAELAQWGALAVPTEKTATQANTAAAEGCCSGGRCC